MYYTGIGSRKTPDHILELMTSLARELSKQGYTLRSGGAEGADRAFELGSSLSEIYIPWIGFEGSKSRLLPNYESEQIASTIHPVWNQLSQGSKKLHARNVNQVLGKDLKTPSKFVIAWTLNGELKGGTATALRLAMKLGIPIYNLAIMDCSVDIVLNKIFFDPSDLMN